MAAILLAGREHIDQIISLNKRYLVTNLPKNKTEKGFIRIEYSEADIREIIRNEEIVVALSVNKVIGYYLIGKKTNKSVLEYQQKESISFALSIKTEPGKLGYGCQVCIDENFRSNGLFHRMLGILSDAVRDKYNYLLCSVSEENPLSLKRHLNNGWQVFRSGESVKFLTYPINNM